MTTDKADPERLDNIANMAGRSHLTTGQDLNVPADWTAGFTSPLGKTTTMEGMIAEGGENATHRGIKSLQTDRTRGEFSLPCGGEELCHAGIKL